MGRDEEIQRGKQEGYRTSHLSFLGILSANVMLVLLFPHVDWFADETSTSARKFHWLVEQNSSEHRFFWGHVWLGCVCPAWCGGWLSWVMIKTKGEEMADGRWFCSEHEEEELWQAVGSSKDCIHRGWGDRGACTC